MEEQENTGNTENKKTKVIIIGHVDHGKTTLTAALMQALKIKEEDIIIVGAGDKLPTVSAKMKESEDPFDNTPKFVIKNYAEPLPELRAIDLTEHNPWPSPKGRKGKRRW